MSTPTPGRTWVDSAPPLVPYRYGLFSVTAITDGEGPWQKNGVEYFTDHCAQGGYVQGMCPAPAEGGGTTHDKTVFGGPELAEGSDPFTIYARAQCNAVGFDDPRGMALTRLGLIEEREAERFFSEHVVGADDADYRYPLGEVGPAVSLARALGALEADAALNYAGAPTLHAPRWAQPFMDELRLLQPNKDTGATRLTCLDSPIAFGGGYFDNPFAPTEALTTGTFWLAATGTVRGSRGAAFANETFKTNDNTRMALAERTYAFDADCYRAAVLVSVDGGSA
ncbi:hypothetical protein ACFPC0_10965 [Streptomyces andamanensis]|uniref:Phage major capsid protein n=1 Tax=Streptomyces andamanensis TaxID=1565035 RepID=A0ABV8TCM1_9ACTN